PTSRKAAPVKVTIPIHLLIGCSLLLGSPSIGVLRSQAETMHQPCPDTHCTTIPGGHAPGTLEQQPSPFQNYRVMPPRRGVSTIGFFESRWVLRRAIGLSGAASSGR